MFVTTVIKSVFRSIMTLWMQIWHCLRCLLMWQVMMNWLMSRCH